MLGLNFMGLRSCRGDSVLRARGPQGHDPFPNPLPGNGLRDAGRWLRGLPVKPAAPPDVPPAAPAGDPRRIVQRAGTAGGARRGMGGG